MWENAAPQSESQKPPPPRPACENGGDTLLWGQMLFCTVVLLVALAARMMGLPFYPELRRTFAQAMQPEQDFFLSTERYFSKFTEKAAAAIAQALPATPETARQPRRKPQPPANAREESYTPNFPLLFPLPGGSCTRTSGYGWRTDFIRGIRSQTDKLDFLFQALVKTSRLETGVIQLNKKPGRLFDTVAQAMSGIVYASEKKEIAVSVDCPEDLTVSHDSKWTSEALFNLLDNAVKYTPAGGKITVSVVLWEMYVEIKVTDTGKGISESNQAAIFRRFYREEEVHEQQGVGIGLYLAREIVTRQGGYIKVVSEPGKGSEFSIMLPTK